MSGEKLSDTSVSDGNAAKVSQYLYRTACRSDITGIIPGQFLRFAVLHRVR
jgi:hypothetical protein